MRRNCSLRKYLLLLAIVSIVPFVWVEGEGKEKAAAAKPGQIGVFIVTHDEIIRSGARNLADVLSRIPGVRISTNSVQSRPSAGPLVSSDSPTQVSASHFSRVLILFNGHHLNKYWHSGADHEWGTGFLEGLKEIRVYTGPAAMTRSGGNGAMDMVIDLIPFEGSDQKGSFDICLTQSLNEDRLDKSLLHFSTGNRWGSSGHFSVFADVTRWGGVDVLEPLDFLNSGSRMERKNPSFQLGGIFKKGSFNFMARHLEHNHFDPYYVGRKWTYSFAEASGTFTVLAGWDLQITASLDRIVSKWGSASSAEGKTTGDWDKVTEFRILLRAGLKREFKRTSIFFGADFQDFKIDGGPERSDSYYSIMNFSTRRNRAGASLQFLQRLSGPWQLRESVRVEKAEGYSDTAFLPEISLFYQRESSNYGLSFATGHRYMDTWYRVGSDYYNPDKAVAPLPYIVPVELEPERNQQLKAWIDQNFGEHWNFYASAFIGKYSHLMGLDWDYALEYLFNRLRAMEVGNYSYWGGSGSLFYKGEHLGIGANVSIHGVFDSRLTARQFYLSPGGNQPLFLPPVTANFFLDWTLSRRMALSARFNTGSRARNGGIDFTSPTLEFIFDSEPYEDTPSYTNLDISFRLFNIWKKFEIQLSVHNVFNDHARLPMIEGGSFLLRGRELTLTLRSKF
jgi:hypothetical protein